jgi:hypothetical protein
MFPTQRPDQPHALGADFRLAAAKGFLYTHSRLSTNLTKTLKALLLNRRNDQSVWPEFPNHMVNPAVCWLD